MLLLLMLLLLLLLLTNSYSMNRCLRLLISLLLMPLLLLLLLCCLPGRPPCWRLTLGARSGWYCCCRTVAAARNEPEPFVGLWLKRLCLRLSKSLQQPAIYIYLYLYKIRGWMTTVKLIGFFIWVAGGLGSPAPTISSVRARRRPGRWWAPFWASFGGHHISVYLGIRNCRVRAANTLQEKRLGTLDLLASFRNPSSSGYQP